MAAKIKLQRVGAKNQPCYRVVIQDESAATDSDVVAVLGQYQPLKDPSVFSVDREKTLEWIKKGAKPTPKVRILLGKAGILPAIDLAVLPKKKKKGVAAEVPAAVAEVPAAVPAVAPKPAEAPAEAPKPDEPPKPASAEASAGKEEPK